MSNEGDSPDLRRRYEEAVEWLFQLQDQDQSIEQIERWIEWCRADPANQQAFERLMPLWQVRAAMPAEAAVAQFATSRLADARARRWRPATRRYLAAAAAVIAAVGVAALLWPLLHAGRSLQLAAVAGFSSEHAQARSAQLVDGSQIALGAQSQVAVNYGNSRRDIEIEHGEAFFTVKHDQSRPFVVRAGNLQVVAVGTAFDVNRQGTRVSVTVQQGVVEVSDQRPGSQGGQAPLRVARGAQLVFDESGDGALTLRAINPDFADAWRRGRFEYVAEPLSAIVEDLNRYSSERIVLQDPSLGALRYSGTIDVTLIDEWLRALPNIFAMRVQFANNHQVVLDLPQTP